MSLRQASATRIAVLASGTGSNLQAILDAVRNGSLKAIPALVLSDVSNAKALDRARAAGVRTAVVAPRDYEGRAAWTEALSCVLQEAGIDLVVLAGFMRIVGARLIEDFCGRMLNIHPSLLPAYRGLDTYRKVLAAGDAWHGTSVHFVTEELDAGPVIAQARIAIRDREDECALRQRVQAAEHWLYPLVIGWYAAGRLDMREAAVWLDGKRLDQPLVFPESGPG